MLYDGALRFVAEAQAAVARNDIRGRVQAVTRALAIIAELQNTLKIKEGGAVAEELDRLYSYIMMRLLDVSLKRDTGALDEVRKLLLPVREAWAQTAAAPAPL